jgi:hypothetical protein
MRYAFFRIENLQVVGWVLGTDDQADSSSTSVRLEEWRKAGTGRAVIRIAEKDLDRSLLVDATKLKVVNGVVRLRTSAEIQTAERAKNKAVTDREARITGLKDSVRSKLIGVGLTADEADWLIGERERESF